MSHALRTLLRGVGQTLITLGVMVLLFVVYEVKVTGLVTEREQGRLDAALEQQWAQPPPSPGTPDAPATVPVASELGNALARLHVPALEDYDPWVVVEGTSVEALRNGPGHIVGTALPGQLGNVVLSGHRTTYGAPFERFGDLEPGGQVVLETRDGWFTYTVQGSQIVPPTAVEVTYAVPGDPTATPTKRLLTLTTCHPKYSARSRLIVRAELTEARDKADGPPPALAGRG